MVLFTFYHFIMAQEIARVARRLEEAKETKRLDLSACELNQVPDATYLMLKHSEIEVCDLSGNTIKRIQSKFCAKLPTLTELLLQGNRLTTLPDDLITLEKLKVLDISDNNFETLPSCLYECPKLSILTARNNKIIDIDVDRLRKMSSLQEINIQDNPLSAEVESRLSKLDMITVHKGTSDPIGQQLDELE